MWLKFADKLTELKPGFTGEFVIQKHSAEHAGVHFDLRLSWLKSGNLEEYKEKRLQKTPEPMPENEKNLVLESWAVRYLDKLLSGEKDRVLAMHVEPHPYNYLTFSGKIPEGYGKGTVVIFDSGTWQLLKMDTNKFTFKLSGKKIQGEYSLINTKDSSWLLIKNTEEK